MPRSEIVSDPGEQLILVDSDDREIGTLPKRDCHVGDGILHRAFSVFLFNHDGEVLLQRRSAEKPLWPLYWSNACCSHPRVGEAVEAAARRRLKEELGVSCPLGFLYKFEYQARFEDVGAECELCHVYLGIAGGPFDPNASEIAELRFFARAELTAGIAESPDEFTPWLRLEWPIVRNALDAAGGSVERVVSGS
ncbi:MAG: isopentenyl-diphosphate Delta-isomerase [Woeseiaceae bacterium]|nr:isopentenyl-diphosphate Delta-isomerase [Woeseiaceae bacterium]